MSQMGTKTLPKNQIGKIGRKVANIMLSKKINAQKAVDDWEKTEITESYKKYDIQESKDKIAKADEQHILKCYEMIQQEDEVKDEAKTSTSKKKGKSGEIAPILHVELIRGKIAWLQNNIGDNLLKRLKKRTKVELDCGDEAEPGYVDGDKVGCFYK